MKRKNFLLPCVKATSWTHTSAEREKRVYDKPKTPYQRLLDTSALDQATTQHLAAEHAKHNPAAITRGVTRIQQQLINLAAARTRGTRPAA
ncbi:integrase catalytic region [Arachnia propionica]|uniref:integrase catalytic region n=1 Tax=Arachnia propionica TaxID=1750 RepID=UPI00398FBB4A